MLDFMRLVPAQKLSLQDGRVVEVLENMGDGMWIRGRTLLADGKASEAQDDELIHCEEVVGLYEG